MTEKSAVKREGGALKNRQIWVIALWPLLITASFPILSYYLHSSARITHTLIAISGLATATILTSGLMRSDRGFSGGILLSVAALSVATSSLNIGVVLTVSLFAVLIAINEIGIHVIRLSNAYTGGEEEREKMLREFLKGHAMNILKITAAVLVISVGLLLLLPVMAIWTSSAYAIVFMGALAGISGYYILTRE